MQPLRFVLIPAAVAAGVLSAGGALAHVPDVQIFRAGQTAAIVETREAAVQVFRGVPGARIGGETERASAAVPAAQVVAAGSRLWLVDNQSGSLSVCHLAKTTQVGGHRIDCQTGALPQ